MCQELVGECWLQSAQVARKAGHHQTAFNALLNADNTNLAELVTEKAKWLWTKVLPTREKWLKFSQVASFPRH